MNRLPSTNTEQNYVTAKARLDSITNVYTRYLYINNFQIKEAIAWPCSSGSEIVGLNLNLYHSMWNDCVKMFKRRAILQLGPVHLLY